MTLAAFLGFVIGVVGACVAMWGAYGVWYWWRRSSRTMFVSEARWLVLASVGVSVLGVGLAAFGFWLERWARAA